MTLPIPIVTAFAVLLVAAAPAAASEPVASFTYSPAAPAVGEEVHFESTSTPSPGSTQSLSLAWDLDGDGQFDDAEGRAAKRAFDAGEHVVRLRARHGTAGENVATRTLQVGPVASPTPTPVPAPPANTGPVAAFSHECTKQGTFVLCAGLFAREQKPHVIDATPSRDPDGSIVRYEWDLDGTGGFEVDGGTNPKITHTFEHYKGLVDPGKRTVRVRVTDNAGATSEASLTLTLLEPACEQSVKAGWMHVTGQCLRPRMSDGSVRWTSKLPVSLNGITIVPKPNRTFVLGVPHAGSPGISSNGATVSVSVKGVTTTLVDGAFSWGLLDGKHVSGFKLAPNARLNGLKITGLAPAPMLAGDGTSKLGLRVALPAQFGGPTSDEPILVTPGKAGASASEPLKFEVRDASIGPIGLDHLTVTFDGEDLWEISAGVELPDPIPYKIEGDAGIRNGEFEHAGAAINFGTPGIGPLGPVFLQRISFRIEVKPKKSKCVPKTGVELFDQRKMLHDITGRWFDVPNFEIDHGHPTFALCGEVGLTAGPTVLGVAAIGLDAGLGLATYDDRPTVLRAYGKVRLVEIPLADADLEIHTNGYTRMRAQFNWGIDGLASLRGGLQFEMKAPKFNAMAHVDACLEFVDWCAGARAIVSSKGVAVCLKINVIFDDWEPGFGYKWGEVLPTLYFAGCDIGEYKEHIQSGINNHITAVPSAVKAKKAGSEQAIDLPAGLPGATIVAKGLGAAPKLTLIGPKGERITTPDDAHPLMQAPFLVMKDPRGQLTQFAISKPSAGRWRVVVEAGSVPVTSLASAQGLEKPEIDVNVTGHGQKRVLSYRVKPVVGQKVTFIERGGSAGQQIGDVANSSGRLPFRPAAGAAERRKIIALVSQGGVERGEYEIATYRAPAAARPARPHHLRVARRHGGLRVSWKGNGPHEAKVQLADGRRVVLRTRKSSVFVRGVKRSVSGTVSVRGVLDSGVTGRSAKVRVGRR